jgi:hypothetical protein
MFGREMRAAITRYGGVASDRYCVDPSRAFVDSLCIERVSDVRSLPVEWLWPGRIPLGRLTLVAGEPGIGKSLVAVDLAARVSRGAAWPDHPERPQKPAGAIIFSLEDDLRDTILPRLNRAGADLNRTFACEGVWNHPPFENLKIKRQFRVPDDILSLHLALQELWPVRLVIIDPINAYCGKGDGSGASVVHSMLWPLAELAAQYNVAIVCTTHLRSSGRRALYRAAGSLSFTTAARAVWGIMRHPHEATKRVMLPVKMNLAPDITGLGFRIDETGAVVWDDEPVALTADGALEAERDGSKFGEATQFLKEILADGPRSGLEVIAEAADRGISRATLKRARLGLKVLIDMTGPCEKGRSKWSLKN